MTVAVFSDIHSNYPALRACYADALANGADSFLFLGDYVSDLSQPREVLDLVYEIRASHPTHCLRGNRERYMLDCRAGRTQFRPGSKEGSLLFTYERLWEQDFRFFASLPTQDTITLSGATFELAHAFREDDRRYFEPDTPEMEAIFPQLRHPFLLTGHSHRQYLRSRDGKTILNPGSVGVPMGGGRWPQYALLDIRDGAIQCRLRQVPYDLEAVIHAQFASGLTDQAQYWAVSILYDLITGQEYAMELLSRVFRLADTSPAGVYDEALWEAAATEMGMRFTEPEILEFWKNYPATP